VNVQERIAKLEALLSRVSSRAAEPRHSVAGSAALVEAPPAPPAAFVAPHKVAVQARQEPAHPVPVEEETEELELDAVELTSVPPPPVRPEATVVPAEDPTESRERMVAAPAVDEVTDAVHLSRSSSDDDAPELEVSGTTDLENEAADEELPASSRRPIHLEPTEPPLEELAFGDAPAPPMPHTPPPESGRQVAVTPPELDFDGEATGVRSRPEEAIAKAESSQSAAEAPRAEVASAQAKSVPPAAAAPVAKLTPQVVRPSLDAPDGGVAVFVGQPAEFKPSSFGDLLDASIDL
jgi:hypothetical protein